MVPVWALGGLTSYYVFGIMQAAFQVKQNAGKVPTSCTESSTWVGRYVASYKSKTRRLGCIGSVFPTCQKRTDRTTLLACSLRPLASHRRVPINTCVWSRDKPVCVCVCVPTPTGDRPYDLREISHRASLSTRNSYLTPRLSFSLHILAVSRAVMRVSHHRRLDHTFQ